MNWYIGIPPAVQGLKSYLLSKVRELNAIQYGTPRVLLMAIIYLQSISPLKMSDIEFDLSMAHLDMAIIVSI